MVLVALSRFIILDQRVNAFACSILHAGENLANGREKIEE
jgi:hypothetical protein